MNHSPLPRTNSKLPEDYIIKLEQDFIVGEPLGEGGYGQIIKAKHKLDNNEYAIKIIKYESDPDDLYEIEREVQNLSQLNHKNIVRYFNSWTEIARIPPCFRKIMQDDSILSEIQLLSENGLFGSEPQNPDEVEVKYLFIQMELCDTRTLRTAINEDLYLQEGKIVKYFTEICEGLSHIHQHHIVHRDIKPENIFLTAKDEIKIGDFGLSKQIAGVKTTYDKSNYAPNEELPFGSLTDACGTPMYTAPELFKRNTFNIKADIYSLGVTYFEMCWKPTTEMEKAQMFPLSSQKFKNIKFCTNDAKKKSLIKKLAHLNDNERPTCHQILEILKTRKSTQEINEIIQQNKNIPKNQFRNFEKVMKCDGAKVDLNTYFTSVATKIFELHGAQNIQMPTFLPPFTSHSDNLVTILNRRGHSSSVSNTSRIAFSFYVANNSINHIRRYNTGKVFEEGYFSPSEYQECVLQSVTPDPDDFVNDAEILFIGKQLCDNIFPKEANGVRFFINHSSIFFSILRAYNINDKNKAIATNIMMNFSNKVVADEEISKTISSSGLDEQIINFTKQLNCSATIDETEKQILGVVGKKPKSLARAIKHLKEVVKMAGQFGIDPNKIHLDPLLINRKQNSRLMFKIVLEDKVVLASGGRFESLIKMFKRTRQPKLQTLTAIDISFNVDGILQMLRSHDKPTPVVDVVIRSEKKATAIPLMTQLFHRQVKCQIVSKQVAKADIMRLHPVIMLELVENNNVIIWVVMESNNSWSLVKYRECPLANDLLEDVIRLVSTLKF